MGVRAQGHVTMTRMTKGADLERGSGHKGVPTLGLKPLSISPFEKNSSSLLWEIHGKPGIWPDPEGMGWLLKNQDLGLQERALHDYHLPISLNKDKHFRSLSRDRVGLG